MKRVLTLALFLLMVSPYPLRAEQAAARSPLVLMRVTVIDATGAPAQPDMTVVIAAHGAKHRRDRISALGKTGTVALPPDAQVIDASGKFIIPGLRDMHTHIAYGVTGIRDMGGALVALTQLREEIAAGHRVGLRIYALGLMLDGSNPPFPQSVGVSTAAEGRQTVLSLRQQGADYIKVQSLIPRDVYLAVMVEAGKQGLPVAGHLPDQISATEASDAGQRSMEHCIGWLKSSSTEEQDLIQTVSVFDFLQKKERVQRVLVTHSAEKA